MNFVARANRIPADPSLMLEVIRITGFAHNDPKAAARQMSVIVELLQNTPLGDDERSMAAASISFRLEALSSLVLSARKHGWALPAERASITPEMLIRCAAEEPLVVHKGRPAFDPEGFGRRLRTSLS